MRIFSPEHYDLDKQDFEEKSLEGFHTAKNRAFSLEHAKECLKRALAILNGLIKLAPQN